MTDSGEDPEQEENGISLTDVDLSRTSAALRSEEMIRGRSRSTTLKRGSGDET
jgi:hypothetical protein